MSGTPRNADALAIGIDVGATTTRAALVTPDARVLQARRIATPKHREDMRAWLVSALDELCALAAGRAACVRGVGIGVPGLIGSDRDRVTRCVAVSYLEGAWLRESLTAHVSCPVVLCTDIEASTLAEYRACEPSPPRFAHLRLGTGAGLGVIVDGVAQAVEPDRQTHAAILVAEDGGHALPCPCGLRGCLETVVGGRAMTQAGASLGYDGLPDLQRACERREPAALHLLGTAGRAVAHVAAKISDAYAPTVLVLGGGVIEHLPALFSSTVSAYGEPSASDNGDDTAPAPLADPTGATIDLRIDHARRGDDAGIVGAGLPAFESL